MHKLLCLLLAIVSATIVSCGQQITHPFPSQVQTVKTSQHVRVLGTKVWGVFPKDYQYIKQLARYQKNDNLYIQVVSINTNSFAQAKPNLTQQAMEAKGAKVDIWQTTRLNGYDAIYVEGPSKRPDETKLMLAFGNNTFMIMVLGVAKTDDKSGIAELRSILQTIYYDENYQLNPVELADFTFDQTITHFSYAYTAATFFVYAENGKDDIGKATANTFQLALLPKVTGEKSEEFMSTILGNIERHGVTLENKTVRRTTFNGYPAYVTESEASFQGKSGIVYQVILEGSTSNLIFSGSAYDNSSKYLDLYKRTVQTIKFK